MNKNTFFTGQPIFTQLLSFIPHSIISRLSSKCQSDRYCKKFTSHNHLVTMLFCSFHKCSSLRELITGMQANAQRLQHLGITNTPRRSTLSDANKRRNEKFFELLYHELYKRHYGSLPDSLEGKPLEQKLFIIDSTTMTLFTDVMKGAGSLGLNGKKKGGAKAHVVINAENDLPVLVRITPSSMSDRPFLSQVFLPKGSVVVMDKGYNSYKKMAEWTADDINWITRLNKRAVWSLKEELVVKKDQEGVIQDRLILLGNPKTVNRNPIQTVRLVSYFDQEKNRTFDFITNDLLSEPLYIAQLYKRRWQIEVLFKRIKQNFTLRNFLGDNENAIKIQIWCSLIADLLVKLVKDKTKAICKRTWSFTNLAGLIRQHLTTYIDLFKFLANPEKALLNYIPPEASFQYQLFRKGAL